MFLTSPPVLAISGSAPQNKFAGDSNTGINYYGADDFSLRSGGIDGIEIWNQGGVCQALFGSGGGVPYHPALADAGSQQNGIEFSNGSVKLYTRGAFALQVNDDGLTPVNFLTINNRRTTFSPSISAINSGDTNVDVLIEAKGTGTFGVTAAQIANGGGAAPTLGTIGGSGPAAAAQSGWLKVKVGGNYRFVPIWA